MPLSPFDHPWQSGVFADEEATRLFAPESDLAAMLDIETALAVAEADEGLMSQSAAKTIAKVCAKFRPDMEALRAGFARDGVVVPELVRQLRAAVPDEFRPYVHFGATSQDIADTSLILRLKQLADHLGAGLDALTEEFARLSSSDGARSLMGRTRMQPARPITLAAKIAAWREPLLRHRLRLDEIRPRLLMIEFGGAVGTRNELGVKAEAVADRLADRLGLLHSPFAHHSQRDGFVEFGSWLALVSGSLGKFGADIALMAIPEIDDVRLTVAGTSSAMPGKSNPVKAEVLVALARFNGALAGGFNQAMVHENERSGAAWTLEWLILPQMAMSAAASVKLARALLASLDFSGG